MNDFYYWLAVQVVGYAGVAASIISFQCRTHGSIMFFRTLNELLFAVQYMMLGAYTAVAMNLIGSTRNIIFAEQVRRGRSTRLTQWLFSLLFAAFGAITWQGPQSLLITFAKVVSTFAYGLKNVRLLRLLIFITSSLWCLYNAVVMSTAGIICEAFTLASIVVAAVRMDLLPAIRSRAHK